MASLIHDYETFEDHLFYSDTTEEEYIKQYVVVNSDLTGCKCCKCKCHPYYYRQYFLHQIISIYLDKNNNHSQTYWNANEWWMDNNRIYWTAHKRALFHTFQFAVPIKPILFKYWFGTTEAVDYWIAGGCNTPAAKSLKSMGNLKSLNLEILKKPWTLFLSR